jgi:hypothetical protein
MNKFTGYDFLEFFNFFKKDSISDMFNIYEMFEQLYIAECFLEFDKINLNFKLMFLVINKSV